MLTLPVTAQIARRAAGLSLSAAETTRYSRHLLLPEVGSEGQRRLKAARVLVVGAGGLGSPVSLYLAAAGVGTLGLVEFDTVDTTNLQRQILFSEADAGKAKLDAAAARLAALNSACRLVRHAARLDVGNVEALVRDYDLVVDGTDNFATRYLLSDCCVFLEKPYVYGSIFRFDGQASVFYAPHGPCYRCLFPAPPPPGQVPSCAEGGVLGVLPCQIGMIQATEAIKLVLGVGESLLGRLLTVDAMTMRFSEFRLKRDPACPVCGANPTIRSLQETVASCEAHAAPPALGEGEMTVDELHRLRQEKVPHVLVDVRTAGEAAVCRIEGAVLVPMAELEARMRELPRDVPLVVHCKSGGRSAKAVAMLREQGYTNAKSLTGGILRWIDVYDPSQPRY